jgi:hypothetical protein
MSFNIDVSGDTLIDANNLRNNNVQKRKIKENVIEIIRKIDEDVKIAHREGKHCIITEIPIIFDIPNMNNKDAQRSVWANIIDILKQKNYRVAINHDNSSCRLKITWISNEDELILKSQIQILNEHKANNF